MNPAQKSIGILSDITFDLILKAFQQDIPQQLLFNKYEDITSALATQAEALQQADYLFVHCETIFNRYEPEQLQALIQALNRFATTYKGTLILSGFAMYNRQSDLSVPPAVFPEALPAGPNILYADFASLVSDEGLKNVYHFPLGHLYQMPFTKPFIKKWAAYLKEYFCFLDQPEKKVIVLDCDNTLWGGILGEDGLDGIRVNKNADGIRFLHFQQWLRQKAAEGFLLCLCSKNNEADVKEAFDKKNMPLRWDDFIVKQVNWQDKYNNLQAIATTLNLGAASFIFIDDNEFEIESVRALMPEVSCIHFPDDYSRFLDMIQSFLFKRKRVLQEDKEKQRQYLEEQQREAAKQTGSFEDYIRSLQIVTVLQINEEQHLERYAQMTEKTNQFNFNKIAYTPAALKQFIAEGNYVFGLQVADRFGDYGIVGMILARVDAGNNKYIIHNYLMSCRALGRGIEEGFYSDITQFLRAHGLAAGAVEFVETAKNQPAKSFYERIVI